MNELKNRDAWSDRERETMKSLFPKLDLASFRLETGYTRTIINVNADEVGTLTNALLKYQDFVNGGQ